MPDAGSRTEAFPDRLRDELLSRSLVEAGQLERVRRIQEETGDRPDQILIKLGLVSEGDMMESLGACLGLPAARPVDYPSEPVAVEDVDPGFLKRVRIIPLADTPGALQVAAADPLDRLPLESLSLRVGKRVHAWIGLPEDIEAAYERLYGNGGSMIEQILEDDPDQADAETGQDIERLKDLASEAPVIRLVNAIIGKAVEARASDIHVEPFERHLRVRYRIDGVLQEMEPPPNRLRAAIVSRVKIMAHLDIAETRLPQDGRIKLAIRGKEVDMRVATVPGMHGESAVLRILDQSAVALDFASLGMTTDFRDKFLRTLDQPHGILLVTGPTGSGKTTTLYTSLQHLNNGQNKILTAEDPIEYQLDGVNQVQVRNPIGLSFAKLLRSFLRQDPDVIMIGEIRDLETAQIAAQAALTGHLVLSTLHTNNAASTITRLLDMGIEEYLIASTLTGILAQRLVRCLCPHCREAVEPAADLLEQFGGQQLGGQHLNGQYLGGQIPGHIYRPRGCEICRGSGYLGRTSIHELLVMTDDLRSLILKRVEAQEIQRAALTGGMQSISQDGLAKVLAGVTSVAEVARVCSDL